MVDGKENYKFDLRVKGLKVYASMHISEWTVKLKQPCLSVCHWKKTRVGKSGQSSHQH